MPLAFEHEHLDRAVMEALHHLEPLGVLDGQGPGPALGILVEQDGPRAVPVLEDGPPLALHRALLRDRAPHGGGPFSTPFGK